MAARAYEWRDNRKVTLTAGVTVEAGQLAILGRLPIVLLDSATAGQLVSAAVSGGVKLPKQTGFALYVGDPVYVDTGSDQRAESSSANDYFGVCIEDAGSSDTEVWVRLSEGAPAAAKSTAAAAGPTVDDDVDLGYSVGSKWYDTASDIAYICLDATDGAAVWKRAAGGVVQGSVTFGAADTSKTASVGALYNGKLVHLTRGQQDQGACIDAVGAVSGGTLTVTGTAPGGGKTAIWQYLIFAAD